MSLARLPDSLLLTLRWSALEAVPRAAPIHTVVPTSVFDLVDELGVDWLSVTSARGADPAAPLRARSLPPAGSLVEAQCGPLCDQGKWDALRRAISGLSGAAVSGVPAWDAASRSAAWLPPSALASDARAPGTAELHRAAFPVDEACLEHFGRLLDLVPCGPAEGAKDLFFRTRRVPFSYYGFQVSVFAPAGKPSAGERAAGFELTLRLQLHRQHEAALFSALGSRNMTGCGAANRTSVASGPDSRVQRVYPSSSLAIDPSLFGDPPEPDAAAMAAAEPDESPLGAWRSVEELEGSRARLHYRLALATTPTGTGANVTVEDLLPWYVRPVASSIRVEGPRRGGAAEPSLRLEPSWSRTAPSKLTVTASLLPGDSLAVSIEVRRRSCRTLHHGSAAASRADRDDPAAVARSCTRSFSPWTSSRPTPAAASTSPPPPCSWSRLGAEGMRARMAAQSVTSPSATGLPVPRSSCLVRRSQRGTAVAIAARPTLTLPLPAACRRPGHDAVPRRVHALQRDHSLGHRICVRSRLALVPDCAARVVGGAVPARHGTIPHLSPQN